MEPTAVAQQRLHHSPCSVPEGAGPVLAGVFSALFVLAVLVLMYYCCKQDSRLGQLKAFALPSKLRQQFRYDGVPQRPWGPLWVVVLSVVVGLIQGRCMPPSPLGHAPRPVLTDLTLRILCGACSSLRILLGRMPPIS